MFLNDSFKYAGSFFTAVGTVEFVIAFATVVTLLMNQTVPSLLGTHRIITFIVSTLSLSLCTPSH